LEEGGDKASTPMPLKAGESARLTFQAPGTCDGDGKVLPTQQYRDVEIGLDTGTLALPGVEPALCDGHFAGKTIVGFPPQPTQPGTVASLAAASRSLSRPSLRATSCAMWSWSPTALVPRSILATRVP